MHSDPLLGQHKHCFHSSNINMDPNPDPNPIRFGCSSSQSLNKEWNQTVNKNTRAHWRQGLIYQLFQRAVLPSQSVQEGGGHTLWSFINNERVVHGEVKYDRCHISRFLGCFVNKQQIFKRTTLKQNCQVVKFSEKNLVYIHSYRIWLPVQNTDWLKTRITTR